MATREEAKQSLEEFCEQVLFKLPMFDYFGSAHLSTMGRERPETSAESFEDFCFVIGLAGELPEGLSVPESYNGFAIITRDDQQNWQH